MAGEAIRFRPSTWLLTAWAFPAFAIGALVGLGLGFAASLVAKSPSTPYFVGFVGWLIVFVVGAGGAFWHFFSIHYELTDRYLSACYGIFWKVCRTTPLEKITNLDVRQGPLAWVFHLGDIWIQTASTGSGEPEVKLIGLADAKRIHDLILERCDITKRGVAVSAGGLSARETTDVLATLSQISETLKSIEKKLDRGA